MLRGVFLVFGNPEMLKLKIYLKKSIARSQKQKASFLSQKLKSYSSDKQTLNVGVMLYHVLGFHHVLLVTVYATKTFDLELKRDGAVE